MNIKDLAQHLGISIGTVSRALNGKPDVNARTRERVLQAAIELGYSANASGRSLRRGTTQTIAFMLETGKSELRSGDNFFMRVIDAMQAELDSEGYDLIILPCHSATDPTEFLKRVIARGSADAIVVTATLKDDPRIEFLLKSRLPFLTLGRSRLEDKHPWIDLDFKGFVDQTVRKLVELGHERIAITVPPSGSNIASLLRGAYEAAHAEHGLRFDPELIFACEVSEYGGNQVTRQILTMPDRPTALLLNYEIMAFGVYAALREAGLSPGTDLSVAAIRRSKQLRFLDPPVTAFDIDLEDLGRTLAREVLKVLRGEGPFARLIWPASMILTDSFAPPPKV
ncbi:LacI family DNA-binding transcriptional regulator [Roseibium salinum]|uniref:Substrate-binding domain-containing protein n=1 Tax=Roseibium salinum TaxID=1604349 RepID=A0ABT3R925_9HYPH|nr:substrate-binding domain-containing protein [Roseibium sp. DSM 29163]MCX2725624.1 substrate-binding domain-containing protein [Roseibium sp. DSM 29163]MDN3720615.1 substrate-binding domain-containing protein [Roseibium salinum]